MQKHFCENILKKYFHLKYNQLQYMHVLKEIETDKLTKISLVHIYFTILISYSSHVSVVRGLCLQAKQFLNSFKDNIFFVIQPAT